MKKIEILQQLEKLAAKGRCLYDVEQLAVAFGHERGVTGSFRVAVQRLLDAGIIKRAAQGVYYFESAHNERSTLRERLCSYLRPGHYNYISQESALSAMGIISQIPIGTLTLMTTGRSAQFDTLFGVIEFTHTQRPVIEILSNTTEGVKSGPRVANAKLAYDDLCRARRNVHLVDHDELALVLAQMQTDESNGRIDSDENDEHSSAMRT